MANPIDSSNSVNTFYFNSFSSIDKNGNKTSKIGKETLNREEAQSSCGKKLKHRIKALWDCGKDFAARALFATAVALLVMAALAAIISGFVVFGPLLGALVLAGGCLLLGAAVGAKG